MILKTKISRVSVFVFWVAALVGEEILVGVTGLRLRIVTAHLWAFKKGTKVHLVQMTMQAVISERWVPATRSAEAGGA